MVAATAWAVASPAAEAVASAPGPEERTGVAAAREVGRKRGEAAPETAPGTRNPIAAAVGLEAPVAGKKTSRGRADGAAGRDSRPVPGRIAAWARGGTGVDLAEEPAPRRGGAAAPGDTSRPEGERPVEATDAAPPPLKYFENRVRRSR